jgi:hypothetical protein
MASLTEDDHTERIFEVRMMPLKIRGVAAMLASAEYRVRPAALAAARHFL